MSGFSGPYNLIINGTGVVEVTAAGAVNVSPTAGQPANFPNATALAAALVVGGDVSIWRAGAGILRVRRDQNAYTQLTLVNNDATVVNNNTAGTISVLGHRAVGGNDQFMIGIQYLKNANAAAEGLGSAGEQAGLYSGGANGLVISHRDTGNMRFGLSDVLMATLTANGMWQLPLTGATAGIRLGGDVDLYRSAADVLYTPDLFRVAGGADVTAGGLRVKGQPGAVGVDVGNVHANLFLTAGSNAGANDTNVSVSFWRSSTVIGALEFNSDAATVIAGHTKVVGDLAVYVGAGLRGLFDTAGSLYLGGSVRAATGLYATGDPAGAVGSFSIGATSGLGDAANANLQAPGQGTGSGPASMVVNQWIRAYNGAGAGWIPFFV